MDASYVAANQFSVVGDETASFITNRRAKIDCGVDGIKYANIVSSAYSNPNTTVTISESTLTANVVSAWYGVVQPGESGSLPIHSHTSDEGEGGILADQTTFSGTFLHVDGDATVTGTMYAHEYDSYSPLIIKDAGTTVISGTGDGGPVEFPQGISIDGEEVAASTFKALTDTPDAYTDFATDTQITWLIQSDTFNGSTSFTDSSSYNRHPAAWDPPPTPSHSTTYKKIGASSIYVPNGGGLVNHSQSIANFGTGDFTVDCWVNLTDTSSDHAFASSGDGALGNSAGWIFWRRGTNLAFTSQGFPSIPANIVSYSWTPTTGTWNHVAVDRKGTTIRLYLNGSPVASATSSHSLSSTGAGVMLGHYWSYYGLSATLNGYIDELRVVKGDARYDGSSFTPPTEHYSLQGAPQTFDKKQYLTINGDEDALEWEDHTILNLDDTPSSYSDGQFLKSTTDGTEWDDVPPPTFINLPDTPSTYSGTDGQYLMSTGSGTEWTNITVSGTTWHNGENYPANDLGSTGDYYLDTISGSIHTKTAESIDCSSYTTDVTAEGYTIGQENGSYTGGAFDNVLNDGNATGSWYAYDGGYVNTGWTGQDFGAGNEKAIAKYRIYNDSTASAPKTWTFEASVSGTWTGEEIVLDTQTNYSFAASLNWHDFEFYNETEYRYYRLNVSANNGNATYLVVREIEMMECTSSASPGGWTKLIAPGEIVYDSLKLRAPDSGVWELKVTNSGILYTEEVV